MSKKHKHGDYDEIAEPIYIGEPADDTDGYLADCVGYYVEALNDTVRALERRGNSVVLAVQFTAAGVTSSRISATVNINHRD